MGQYSLTKFVGLSFLIHVAFFISTTHYSIESKKELPFRVRLVEFPDIKEDTVPVQAVYSYKAASGVEKDIRLKDVSDTKADTTAEINNLNDRNKPKPKRESNIISAVSSSNQSSQDLITDKQKGEIEPKDEKFDSDTIPLDTKEIKYNSYFDSIKKRISSVWRYPEKAMSQGIKGSLVLRFSISKEGTLLDTRILSSTNYNILDDEAVRAVKTAAPFDKFPENIDKNQLNIIATFSYRPSFISDLP